MTRLNLLLIIVITIFINGCVQVTEEYPLKKTQLAVSSVRDLAITYAPGSTFALSPKHLKRISSKKDTLRSLYRKYANEITHNLTSNQYQLAGEGDKVDFYVGFGLALSEDLSDEVISEQFGITPGLIADENNVKGSFLIYIDDAAINQRVWRGAAQGFVQEESSKEERKERVAKVVDMLLAQFHHVK